MSQIPAKKSKGKGKGVAAALSAARSALKGRTARRPVEDASDDSSSGEDSDAEIDLTAPDSANVTMKPLPPVAADDGETKKSQTASKSKKSNSVVGSKRKKPHQPHADDEEDDEQDNDADEDAAAPSSGSEQVEMIDVEFGIYDPRPIDYLSLKMMLKDYVPITTTDSGNGSEKKKKKKKSAAADDGDEEDDTRTAVTSSASSSDDDFALHELCAALVDQVCAGSMIKGEGTDEPLGFLSALNLDFHSKHGRSEVDGMPVRWVSQLKRHLLKHAPSPQVRSQLESALDDPHTGLLIQSRLINVPPQIIPPLHQCFMEDIAWAEQNAALSNTFKHQPSKPKSSRAATSAAAASSSSSSAGAAATPASSSPSAALPSDAAYRASFRFKQFVLVARTFTPLSDQRNKQSGSKLQSLPNSSEFVSPFASKKKQKQLQRQQQQQKKQKLESSNGNDGSTSEYDWLRFEEELYARESTLRFSFPCPFTSEDAAAGRVPQQCVVLVIPRAKINKIIQELQMMASIP